MGHPARTTPTAVQSTPLYGTLSESEGEKVAIRDALNEELKHGDIAPGLLAEWDRQDAPVWEDEENHSLELDSGSGIQHVSGDFRILASAHCIIAIA